MRHVLRPQRRPQYLAPRRALLAFLLAAATLFATSCSKRATTGAPVPAPSGVTVTELYQSLKDNQAAGNLETAALNARQIVRYYPTYAMIDEVLYRAGEIAFDQGRYADASAYLERLISEQPMSPFRQNASLLAARARERNGDDARSAELLLDLLATPVDPDVRDAAITEIRRLVRSRLSEAELQSLARRYPDSAIVDEVTLDLARKAYARGAYDDCYRALAEFLYRSPDNDQAEEARRLLELASERREAHDEAPTTIVHPQTVGVVLPVTGQLSLYGRFFQQGVQIALDEHNAASTRHVEMVTVDSRGNPVDAALAARRLVGQDGATVLLGSVFTMPTVAAAIEANAWRTPMLSPVVSTDDLAAIGPWVYRTRIPLEVEVAAMVDLAVTRLGLERVAVIAPVRGERRRLGDMFADEATRLGAEVVAREYYEDGATDYREQLDLVREAAPDAIFGPGTVEELLLMLPQVKFYDMQVQLLGLSNWNSDKLLRLSRDDLEGALFPMEAYHGYTAEANEAFRAAMTAAGSTEVSPISEAGYFGMRLLLAGFDQGVASRDDMRAFLERELHGDAESRAAEAQRVSILIVRSGKVRAFNPPAPSPRN